MKIYCLRCVLREWENQLHGTAPARLIRRDLCNAIECSHEGSKFQLNVEGTKDIMSRPVIGILNTKLSVKRFLFSTWILSRWLAWTLWNIIVTVFNSFPRENFDIVGEKGDELWSDSCTVSFLENHLTSFKFLSLRCNSSKFLTNSVSLSPLTSRKLRER